MVNDPRGQLVGSFSRVLSRQAEDLAALVDSAEGDSAVLEAVRYELERIRGTASTLGLGLVARAADLALRGVDGAEPQAAIHAFVEDCHQIESPDTPWSPIVLLGLSAPMTHPYAWILEEAASMEGALAWAGRAAAFLTPWSRVEALVRELRGAGWHTPVYAVGPRDDLAGRLAAAKDGAAGYMHLPLDLGLLLSRAGQGRSVPQLTPYRLLLIEPDPDVALSLISQLSGPDMLVQWLGDGGQLLSVVEDFWPEATLVAARCGALSGAEVMSVMRGHPAFADTPVLVQVNASALADGDPLMHADELLDVASWSPMLLRARVRQWLRRARSGRQSAELDASTGCLGRPALLRAVERELGLARRDGTALSMVVLDIDDLSGIVNNVGLIGGDRVLRGLAEAVASTLRRTDLVGRLGGDSFGALLPRCSAADAVRRVDAMRARFNEWVQEHDLGAISFSAGVAESTGDFADVLPRASRALGAARRAGGGRTVQAP